MPGWVFFSSGAAFLFLAHSNAKGYYATVINPKTISILEYPKVIEQFVIIFVLSYAADKQTNRRQTDGPERPTHAN